MLRSLLESYNKDNCKYYRAPQISEDSTIYLQESLPHLSP